jgi:hypothetical protein
MTNGRKILFESIYDLWESLYNDAIINVYETEIDVMDGDFYDQFQITERCIELQLKEDERENINE